MGTVPNHTSTQPPNTNRPTQAAGPQGTGGADLGAANTSERTQATTTLPYDHHTLYPAPKGPQHWFQITPGDLPTCLKHGLPPDMTSRLTGTYWGTQPKKVATAHQQARIDMGLRDSTYHKRFVVEAEDLATQELFTHNNQTATRQAFQQIR